MEKNQTRQEILEAALELFSEQGFAATSIAQLAQAVGIQKASLYSHFKSKQEILDTLVRDILNRQAQHSIFAETDWENEACSAGKESWSSEQWVALIQKQLRFALHDPYVSRGRKTLVVEQFQNPELAKLLTRMNYDTVLQYFQGMTAFLVRKNVLCREDPAILAEEFCLPITVWLNLCDREPEREEEILEKIERHILHFFRVYGTSEDNRG